MKPDEPQDERTILSRYRRASDADAARPAEATRAAILSEARRVAAAQSRPEVLKPFDTRRGASNQGRWRLAALGTFGLAVLGALVAVPLFDRQPPSAALAPADALVGRESLAPAQDVTSAPSAPEPAPPAMAALPAERAPAAGVLARKATPPADQRLMSQAAAPRQRAKARDAAADSLQEIVVSRRDTNAAGAPSASASMAAPRPARDVPAPILAAVQAGDLAEVTRLLEQGASLRASDDAGRSALFLAVMQHRSDLVRALLARGADPAAPDHAGQTPLAWARQQRDEDMVRLLSTPLATH